MATGKSSDAFRTISEVAAWLGVSAHVLRFWESKFPQIKPVKRAGGRRYYRRSDMELLGGIQRLLHVDGLTIKGAQKVLRERGVKAVAALSKPVDGADSGDAADPQVAQATPLERARPSENDAAAGPSTDADAGEDAATEEDVAAPSDSPSRAPAAPPEASVPPVAAGALPDGPVVAPLPGAEETGQRGLFAGLPPLDLDRAASEAPAPPDAEAPSGAPRDTEAGEADGPRIAPLPGADLSLPEALSRLAPGQIPPQTLAPLLSRARALRDRMAGAS